MLDEPKSNPIPASAVVLVNLTGISLSGLEEHWLETVWSFALTAEERESSLSKFTGEDVLEGSEGLLGLLSLW